MSQQLVSIIVPVYNVELYLEQALRSILEQTYPTLEILLINDGSTDHSYEIIQKFAALDARIVSVTQENAGVSAARNRGLVLSQGEYILFFDADDKMEPLMVEKLLGKMLSEEADVVCCNFYISKPQLEYVHRLQVDFPAGQLSQEMAIESVLSTNGFQGFVWNKLFRRKTIGDCIFNENIHYLEDAIFTINVINRSHTIGYLSQALCHYRQHHDSAISQFSSKQLTYLDALDLIKELVPHQLKEKVSLLQMLGSIKFAVDLEKQDRRAYFILKNYFKENARLIDKETIHQLKKNEQLIVKLARVNFYFGSVVSKKKEAITKSALYYQMKKRIRLR